jgi:ABC-type antimicrobial peptide transport system permease subunit
MVSDFAHLKRTASLYFPVSVLISTFIIVTTGLSMVVSRKQEFAVLRALGESKRQVALLFVAETAVVSLLGGLLGYLMSVALAPVLVHTAAVMDVTPVFVAIAVAILISAVVTRSRAFTELTSTLRNQ